MSQQHVESNALDNANDHVSSSSTADPKPPTSTSSLANTKVEITSQQVSALDITDQFTVAASALHTGELVKDEFFTLFESVGALEIMDSKMDSGYLEPGETLEDEYDVLRALLPEEVIGIMDQLLCHEVAWHMGHPLSQTLFTSLYVERLLWPEPKTLEQAQFVRGREIALEGPWLHNVLRSYCIAMIKACHFVHSMVTSQSYYEEEDFTSQLYHRELLPGVSTAGVQALLDRSLSYCAIADLTPPLKEAIEKRLLFRQAFLNALEQDTGPVTARTKSSLSCLPLLKDIRATTNLGISVDESFSTKIQRTLASSVPPRPMVKIHFADALDYFEKLCNDVADADQILEIESSEDLFTSISVFMSRAPQPSIYIRALVQSFLQTRHDDPPLVLGKRTAQEFFFSSLAAICLPNSAIIDPKNDLIEAPANPRFQMAQLLAEFHPKIDQQYLDIFRNACLNRCRTRRTLCHLVIDWDTLQANAEDLDATLQTLTEEQPAVYASDPPTYSYPLSSWIYHFKLNHIRHIIQIGFELTTYAPDELAGMYWYLSYICGTHLSHIDRVSFFLQRDMQTQDSLPPDPSLTDKSELQPRAAFRRTFHHLFRIYTHLKAMEALSRALHALHSVLLRHKTLSIPPRPFSSDKLRYELRMKPFLSLNVPEPVAFEAFQEQSSFAGWHDEQVLEEAATRIAEARKLWDDVLKAGWSADLDNAGEPGLPIHTLKIEARDGATTIEGEWIKGVKNVIRACIAASICIVTLRRKMDEKGDFKGIKATIPAPGEKQCWHPWWIVPTLSGVV